MESILEHGWRISQNMDVKHAGKWKENIFEHGGNNSETWMENIYSRPLVLGPMGGLQGRTLRNSQNSLLEVRPPPSDDHPPDGRLSRCREITNYTSVTLTRIFHVILYDFILFFI